MKNAMLLAYKIQLASAPGVEYCVRIKVGNVCSVEDATK
jgi:hypothetical protein